jgi:hypothetical protein
LKKNADPGATADRAKTEEHSMIRTTKALSGDRKRIEGIGKAADDNDDKIITSTQCLTDLLEVRRLFNSQAAG